MSVERPCMSAAFSETDQNISQAADHRFANHLALLSGFVRLKASDFARKPTAAGAAAVQLALESIGVQIDAMARLHRSLASGSQTGWADLAEHVHHICAPLSSLLAGRIALVEDVQPGCWVAPDQIFPLAQVVAEVVTNAIKHAYAEDQVGTIIIRGRTDAAGAIVVEIVDGGAGLPDSFDMTRDSGLGFRLIRALARRLEASVRVQSGLSGLRFRLTIPPRAVPSAPTGRADPSRFAA
jgi:two-component sensor histidine kinase